MSQLKAYICLLIFLGSTVTNYASVHACSGELTDIGIFSKAQCTHESEKNETDHCHEMACCKSKNNKQSNSSKVKDKSCCETDELIPVKADFTESESQSVVNVLYLLPTILSFVLPSTNTSQNKCDYSYTPPDSERDIKVEFQVFRL